MAIEVQTLEANKALVRRIYEEVLNQRNLAVADEVTTLDSLNHEGPDELRDGPEGVRNVVRMLSAAFPDYHMTIEDMIAEGDKVVVRSTLSGTHQGAFFGIPPTGKTFTQGQIHILRIENGKVAEHWAMRDDLGMMQQLGAIPAPSLREAQRGQ